MKLYVKNSDDPDDKGIIEKLKETGAEIVLVDEMPRIKWEHSEEFEEFICFSVHPQAYIGMRKECE